MTPCCASFSDRRGVGVIGGRRVSLALVFAATIAGAIDAGGSQAGSVPAVRGTFTMTSDSGDYVGQGQSYSFPGRAIEFGADLGRVFVSVRAADSWTVRLEAPDKARLEAGIYADAGRFSNATQPALDVSGAGRGCNETAGRFTVLEAKYGLRGYLRSLHVTFEQHCEGAASALRGEFNLVAAPPPRPLKVDLTFDASRTTLEPADSAVKLVGTIACSQTVVGASVIADVSEVKESEAAIGSGSLGMECRPTPTSWGITVASSNGIPFTDTTVRVTVRGEATDSWYTAYLGENVAARDVISNAEANLPSSPHPGFISRHSTWSLVIVLLIIAAVGWSLLIVLWIRSRARRQPS